MPKGPLGAPRPMVKSRIVMIVIADGEIPINRNPRLIDDIKEEMEHGSEGPGFPPSSVEYLEDGITKSMMENSGWGTVPDPMEFRSEGHGVYMTFSVPYINGKQIEQVVDSVNNAVEPEAGKYIMGCM